MPAHWLGSEPAGMVIKLRDGSTYGPPAAGKNGFQAFLDGDRPE